jgi:hypothetical protein
MKSTATRSWPYCALIRGLDFRSGNKVFVAINRAFGELVARPYEKPRHNSCITFSLDDMMSARGGTKANDCTLTLRIGNRPSS